MRFLRLGATFGSMAAILAACSDDSVTTATSTPTTTTADAGASDASATGTATFRVGGRVTGLLGSNLVLQNNAGDDLPVVADGTFTFGTALASGAAYAVTVKTQPTNPDQTCTVTGGNGTMADASVTDLSVACSTNAYPVNVTATGVSGTLVLQNNDGDDLTITADGTHPFATSVTEGATYKVTLKTRPLNQTCTITQTSTTSLTTNSVAVSCVSSAWPSTEADGAFAPTTDVVLAPGIHNFTTINVPAGVTVTTSGDGALDLRASGDVVIAGTVDVSGGKGGDGVHATSCNLGTVGSGGASGVPTASTSSVDAGPVTATGGGGAPGSAVTSSRICVAPSGANGGGAGGGICNSGGGGGGFAGGGGGGGYSSWSSAGGNGGSSGTDVGGTGGSTRNDGNAGAGGGGGVATGPYAGGAGAGLGNTCNSYGGGGGGGGAIGAEAVADLAIANTFRSGSAGGGGAGACVCYVAGGGGGGGGAGAIRIATSGSLTVSGNIRANGGAGGASVDGSGGGGGGSGGVVFLAAPTLTTSGTVSAVGGAAGSSSACNEDGGAGGLGRIRISTTAASCTLGGTFAPALTNGCAATNAAGAPYIASFPN